MKTILKTHTERNTIVVTTILPPLPYYNGCHIHKYGCKNKTMVVATIAVATMAF